MRNIYLAFRSFRLRISQSENIECVYLICTHCSVRITIFDPIYWRAPPIEQNTRTELVDIGTRSLSPFHSRRLCLRLRSTGRRSNRLADDVVCAHIVLTRRAAHHRLISAFWSLNYCLLRKNANISIMWTLDPINKNRLPTHITILTLQSLSHSVRQTDSSRSNWNVRNNNHQSFGW